ERGKGWAGLFDRRHGGDSLGAICEPDLRRIENGALRPGLSPRVAERSYGHSWPIAAVSRRPLSTRRRRQQTSTPVVQGVAMIVRFLPLRLHSLSRGSAAA